MKLNEIIFTDGEILSYRKDDNAFVIDFLDYANRKIEITFLGWVEYQDNNGVRIEFADSVLKKINDKQELRLLDDENSCIFKIIFSESKIKTINS
jgi:hypothetical protein